VHTKFLNCRDVNVTILRNLIDDCPDASISILEFVQIMRQERAFNVVNQT